jgi:ribosomal protein S27AE
MGIMAVFRYNSKCPKCAGGAMYLEEGEWKCLYCSYTQQQSLSPRREFTLLELGIEKEEKLKEV